MKLSNSKLTGEAALLLVTLLWGATFVIIKEALNDASPLLFVGARFSIAAILFIPIIYKSRKTITKQALLPAMFLGVLLFLSFVIQTFGLQYTTATKSGFLTGSLVVMIPFFQLLIIKRKPTKGAIIGSMLVFVGILLLSSGGESLIAFFEDLGNNFNVGDFLTLVCAVIFALHVVFLDVFTKKYDYKFLVFMQLFITAVLSVVSAVIFNGIGITSYKFNLSANLIVAILYTSIFATLINTVLQTKFQKAVSPAKAGIIYSFEPIFAAIFAFIILDERISFIGIIGCCLIFAGLIVSEIYDSFFNINGKQNLQS